MFKGHKKFLIVFFIGVVALGVRFYFHGDSRSEAATDSPLTSSLDTTNQTSSSSTGSEQAAGDIAFIKQLESLKRIKIDSSIFLEKGFSLLVNNKIKIEPVPYGRVNPFSPTTGEGASTVSKPTTIAKTNPATLITNKSAVLNGSIKSSAASTNIYFEYGTDEKLGKATPKAVPSLVGSFASNITTLLPATKYFYRSAVGVNGVMYYGEIVSFTTAN